MNHIPDVDIDFADRSLALALLPHIKAAQSVIIDNGELITKVHNSGVYFENIPHHPITKIAAISYKDAEQKGYFKIDFLNAHVYKGITDEHHLIKLMNTEPIWELLQEQDFSDLLMHLNGHSNILKVMKPDSVPKLAAVLAMIRPAKKHLIGDVYKRQVLQFVDYKEFKSFTDEYEYLVTNRDRLIAMASYINEISKTGNTLVLVNRIETGNVLTELIAESSFVSGAVKSKDRKEEYKEIRTSTDKVLISTYGVAAVGLNIPRIFNLVLVEPGKSFVRVIQSIGRGLRKAEDKDFVNVWDFASTCKYSRKHLTERKKYYKDAQYQYSIKKIDWSQK